MKIIHVATKVILENKRGGKKPVLSVIQDDKTKYCNGAIIYGKDGKEAARVVYRPDNPLKSGATVWIETDGKIEIII